MYITCLEKRLAVLTAAFLLITITHPVCAQDAKVLTEAEDEMRIDAYEQELEDYLTHYLVDEYDARAAMAWNRDYSSADALVRSVAPNRLRWEKEVIKPPHLQKTGPLLSKPYNLLGTDAEWLELPLGNIAARAVIAYPEGASKANPAPLVIALHGIGSGPETAFEDGKSYHAYAKALLDAGFAVMAPLNMRSIPRRNNIERLARLADVSLPGIELARLQHLLDVVLQDERIDADRVGAWGVSLGGMATLFWMPLEPRIKAGVVSAWFNHRINKMVVPDERYSSFAAGNEEHAFFSGWLTEFSDHDVVSLICPRPIQIQHGKKDNIAYWPQVVEEFERSKVHYERLELSNRIDLVLHEGSHEALVAEGVAFLKKWLDNDE
ncbi:dienelactone hydrolase family protein [Parapedobacter indicus]|uniref:Alpha/beta hydrolase family protein n=1 Tax=Parapedobacter indicus TaxID=1477437 RepID=A0A1I3FQ84_9SPHI|nr:hypothetical protein [Parapedobacter indicus]PPL03833.1 hypothetical protein CLV26_102441 [Parapedobacter indicus]SFI13334.1 hypothetical protein SAMN05444682_102441 [Parapedobacter indicus]